MRRELTITKADGVNARDAAMIAQRSARFDCAVFLEQGSRRINAKSLMGILSMGLKKDSAVIVSAEGVDAAEAIADLAALIERDFTALDLSRN